MSDSEQDAATAPDESSSLVPGSLAGRLFLLGLFIIFAGGFLAWTQRVEIADDYAADYLAEQGIAAQYDVVDVGVTRQHLRHLVIGDKDAPDLTVDEMIVTTRPGFGTLIIEDVHLRGVRLFGRYDGETLSFGALDPLIFTDSDAPFELPDFILDIDDAKLRMDTPWGTIGGAIKGDGHLKDGFEGELALIAQQLQYSGCTIDRPSLYGAVKVESLEPLFSGPLRGAALACPDADISVKGFGFNADAKASRTLEDIDLALGGSAESPLYAGLDQGQVTAETLLVDLKAALDGEGVDAEGEMALADMRSPWVDGEDLTFRFDGAPMAFADLTDIAALEADIALNGSGLAIDDAWNSQAEQAISDTPLEPLWDKAGPILNQHFANAGVTVEGNIADGVLALAPSLVKQANGKPMARFSGLDMALAGDRQAEDIRFEARIVDKDLPQISADILWAGGLANGGLEQIDLSIPRYAANGAALAVEDMRVRQIGAGDYALAGTVALTGPLPDGKISNLVVPLDGQLRDGSRYYANGRCQKLRFDGLKIATVSADKTAFSLCPVRGAPLLAFDNNGVRVNADSGNLALQGDLAGTPWKLAFEQLLLRYPDETQLADVTAQIGDGESATNITAKKLTLDAKGDQLGGIFEQASGTIGAIPLLIDQGEGEWFLDADGLQLTSNTFRVSDREPEYRFEPLIGQSTTLTLVDGVINVNGALHEDQTGRKVTDLAILHNLESASGNAVLTVDNLRFDQNFQPELITPLTLGLVANVDGRVDGVGNIRWDGDQVTSDGRFHTDNADLAAAFGPVKNLSGEIVFSDLLALETPPGQTVYLGEVNPGVAAFDGVIRYQLLPNRVIRLEGGEWPFSGGRLIMEAASFNMAGEEDRALSFVVQGMDAAQFLSRFDFDNITATGVFDGRLPIIFNQEGGRIEGGRLVVREGGGSLSYVGELTYEDMGSMANFAFDSLRSIQYRSLEVEMNGPLDGEMVTQINFAGLSQGEKASRNFITRQIAKLPIQFNVTIRAPFFQLFTMTRSFYDTQYLPPIQDITNSPATPVEGQGGAELGGGDG